MGIGEYMNIRSFIKKLETEDRIIMIKKPLSKKLEMAGVFKALENKKQPIVAKDKDSGLTVACNIFGDKQLVADALGCKPNELVLKMKHAIDNPSKPNIISKEEAPVLEVEIEPNLSQLPIPLHTEKDGGPYFSSAVVFAKDPELGQNASFHRMMVISNDKVVIRMLPRHLHTFMERAEEQGGPLKIAFAVGLPVNVLLAAATSVELGQDEMAIANTLSPVNLVEVDYGIKVPSDAEYVYIGEITKNMHDEGPFVDLTETLDIVRRQRIVKIEKVYHRKNPIHHVLLPGGLEHKILMGMPREPTIWKSVEKAGVIVKNVNITPGGCSWLHGIVSIEKKKKDDGKIAVEAAFKGHKSMKHVIIVDDDIDISNPNDVEWAIATRFQASKDLYVFENVKGSSLDPSADPNTRLTTKVGLDCTKPINPDEKKKFEKAKYKKVDVDEYIGK